MLLCTQCGWAEGEVLCCAVVHSGGVPSGEGCCTEVGKFSAYGYTVGSRESAGPILRRMLDGG
jgi:hypothetical protein